MDIFYELRWIAALYCIISCLVVVHGTLPPGNCVIQPSVQQAHVGTPFSISCSGFPASMTHYDFQVFDTTLDPEAWTVLASRSTPTLTDIALPSFNPGRGGSTNNKILNSRRYETRVRVRAYNTDASAEEFSSELSVKVQPFLNGECSVSPESGYIDTLFSVHCLGFQASDSVTLTYQLGYKDITVATYGSWSWFGSPNGAGINLNRSHGVLDTQFGTGSQRIDFTPVTLDLATIFDQQNHDVLLGIRVQSSMDHWKVHIDQIRNVQLFPFRSGSCSIEPDLGTPDTEFHMDCVDFVYETGSVTFSYQVLDVVSGLWVVMESGSSNHAVVDGLPIGIASNSYLLDFRVHVTHDQSDYEFVSPTMSVTVMPFSVGECVVFPDHGHADMPYFIDCYNVSSGGGNLTFHHEVFDSTASVWNVVESGRAEYAEVLLPAGLEANDHNISVRVRVSSSKDAYEYVSPTVYVTVSVMIQAWEYSADLRNSAEFFSIQLKSDVLF